MIPTKGSVTASHKVPIVMIRPANFPDNPTTFVKKYKPYVHCTLENTVPENAVATREFMERTYAEV